MLPLNQLEALSEAHAEIIKKKDELDEKMLRLEFEREIEKLTNEALEKAYGVPVALLRETEALNRKSLNEAADAVAATNEAIAKAQEKASSKG